MARYQDISTPIEVVEPPRDGEFFFEEGRADKAQERGVGYLNHFFEKHPALSLGFAVALGMLIAAALLGL